MNSKSIVNTNAAIDVTVPAKCLINFREDVLPLVILMALPVILMGMVLFSGTHIVGSPLADARGQFFYTRLFGFSELAHFSLPLWNPYVFCGTPFVGTLQSAIFYPFNLVFALLPIVPAMNWSIAFHLALCGIFTYYLLKQYDATRFGAVVAGVVYTFSAPQILHVYAGHLNALCAMVWTPLMFLLLDKMIRENRVIYSVFLGLTIALQFLAGQPQYVFYTMIALFLYFLFQLAFNRNGGPGMPRGGIKGVLLFLFAVLIGIAVSAVQILPSLEMTRYSTRENLTYEWVAQFSLPPGHLITYLIPDFFGDMQKLPYWGRNYLWEMSAYIGITPLILVIISVIRADRRVVWFFSWLAMISLLLAFGKYTPLLKAAYTFIPGFHLFRGTSKFIFLNAFSLAVLSGFGADLLVNSCRDKGIRNVILSSSGVALAFVLLLLNVLDPKWFSLAITDSVSSGDFYFAPEQFMTSAFVHAAAGLFHSRAVLTLVMLSITALVLLLARHKRMNRNVLMLLVLALVVCDLFAFSSRYMVSFDSREAFGNREAMEVLRRDREPFRILTPDAEANFGMANRMESLGGYDTIMLKRYSEFINLARNSSPDQPELYLNIAGTNRLTDLLNAKYLLLGPTSSLKETDSVRQLFRNGAAQVYENSNALPRAFVVHGVRRATGRQAVFQELTRPDFDPWSYAIVEEESGGLPQGPARRGKLPVMVSHSADKVVIDADLDSAGLLVLGDAHYPGWKAFVDGQEAEIYPANFVMRSVRLNAGKHRVEFRYAPASFRIGALISLTALLLAAGIIVRNRFRKPDLNDTGA